VGGVSGRPTRAIVLAVATVEGTLIRRVPVAFAGCRRNADLGRSVVSAVGLVPCSARTDDSGCPLEQRGGERRQRAPSARTLRVRTLKRRSPRRRTRPSLGPGTRARQSALNSGSVSCKGCRGRFGIAVGQTCASRRNRHRGRNERTKRGSPHVTAPHVKLGRSSVAGKKRKVVMATVPARKRELGFGCPYVVSAVAEVGRQHPGLE
jgi:hypothetical protein